MAMQDYLKIAREFKADTSNEHVESTVARDLEGGVANGTPDMRVVSTQEDKSLRYEINEINELSTSAGGELSIARAYESKATIPGQKPPLQQIEELQAWLSTIDWGYGLRCGKTGHQCLVCKGIPCHGSTEYQPTQQ